MSCAADAVAGAAVCVLMGSDGFSRPPIATTGAKDPERPDFDRPVQLGSSSIGRFSSVYADKDDSASRHASDLLFEGRNSITGCSRNNDSRPSFKSEKFWPKPSSGRTKFIQLPVNEERQLQLKGGRGSRSNGKCSKRARISQEEDSSSLGITDSHEVGDVSNKHLIKSSSLERNESGKQRNITSKRCDKRNFKLPLRSKSDHFCVKGCSSISNLSTAGSQVTGVYGLKSDFQEVTNLVDDLSLDEILEGAVKCPILGKEKGKKAVNQNEALMKSVRKVCSMIQPAKSNKILNNLDFDNPEQKVCRALVSSVSLEESAVEGSCRDPVKVELSSCYEEPCKMPEMMLKHPLDMPLYQPQDLLNRLALPAPKDLDALLLDASKSISASKSASDLRSGKQIPARRVGLPPFPWSHAFNGHSRTSSDAAKLATGRSTCPGKWARMKNPATLSRTPIDGFTDLDELTYDQSLVPRGKVEIRVVESKTAAEESPSGHFNKLVDNASRSFSSGASLGDRDSMENQQRDNLSPSLLAAAQTLCDISISSLKKSFDKTKWQKKLPSEKPMKSRKLKLDDRNPERLLAGPFKANGLLKYPDKVWPSKKPKLFTTDTERCFAKSPISWAAPRSSRSSPNRLIRESLLDTKLPVINITKPRKPVLPSWNKGREGLQ